MYSAHSLNCSRALREKSAHITLLIYPNSSTRSLRAHVLICTDTCTWESVVQTAHKIALRRFSSRLQTFSHALFRCVLAKRSVIRSRTESPYENENFASLYFLKGTPLLHYLYQSSCAIPNEIIVSFLQLIAN